MGPAKVRGVVFVACENHCRQGVDKGAGHEAGTRCPESGTGSLPGLVIRALRCVRGALAGFETRAFPTTGSWWAEPRRLNSLVMVTHYPVALPFGCSQRVINYHGHLHQKTLEPTELVKFLNVGWDVHYALLCL